MKILKKVLLSCFIIAFLFTLTLSVTSCFKKEDFSKYVSQLQKAIYYGEEGEYKLKATYGFCEQPFKNDGIIEKTHDALIFTLLGELIENEEYTLSFTYKEDAYQSSFMLDHLKNTLICTFEIKSFDLEQFDVTLKRGSQSSKITMQNALPKDCIDHEQALESVWKNQPKLVQNYYDENKVFCGEIRQRVILKDNSAYWYVGLVNKKGDLKAFLVDGKSGNILAIREIF